MTERKTAANAWAKAKEAEDALKGHEDLCAERYKNINDNISDLKDGQKWAIRLSVVTLLGVAAKVVIGG